VAILDEVDARRAHKFLSCSVFATIRTGALARASFRTVYPRTSGIFGFFESDEFSEARLPPQASVLYAQSHRAYPPRIGLAGKTVR